MCILAVSSLIFDIKLYDSGKMYRIAGQTAAIKGVVESISTRSDDKCYAVVSVYSLVFSDDKYHRSSADAEKKELLLDDREKTVVCIYDRSPRPSIYKQSKDIDIKSEKSGSSTNAETECINDPFENGDAVGRKVTLRGEIELPRERRNPGTFDYRMYLKTKKIYTQVSVKHDEIDLSDEVADKPANHISRFRHSFINKIRRSTDEETAGIINAMMFGDKSDLQEDMYESFQKNGIAHILAVSGLHIGCIYAFLCFLWRGRKGIVFLAAMTLFLIIYAAMADFAPSVVRALIMIEIHMLADFLNRPYDMLSAACLTAFVMLVVNPMQLFNTGFQMSFMAVAVLSMLSPFTKKGAAGKISVVFAMQAALVPLIAYNFNYFSFGAFLVNIPVIFMAGIMIPAGVFLMLAMAVKNAFYGVISFAGAAIFDTGGAADHFLFDAGGAFLKMSLHVVRMLNDMTYRNGCSSFDVTSPSISFLWLFYILFFFLLSEYAVILRLRKRRDMIFSVLIAALVIALIAGAGSGKWDADVTFVDVGQGSCMHIKSTEGTNILVDGGGRRDFDIGKKVLKPYLLKNGVKKIDVAFVTHKDMDHYKGIKELKAAGMVDKIITNDDVFDPGTLLINERDLKITAIAPVVDSDDENESCLVLRIDINGVSFLAPGDIGKETEEAICSYWRGNRIMDIDVIAVPHHGSRYSSSEAFIKNTAPEAAVVQVGKNNYGHPAQEVLDRYKSNGAVVLRNDLQGAVGFRTANGMIEKIDTMLI